MLMILKGRRPVFIIVCAGTAGIGEGTVNNLRINRAGNLHSVPGNAELEPCAPRAALVAGQQLELLPQLGVMNGLGTCRTSPAALLSVPASAPLCLGIFHKKLFLD